MRAVNAAILHHMQSDVPLIPQLASYLIASGGKRLRPLLTLAATKLYDGDMIKAHNLAAAVEFIHTATLLHDDVVDESEMRRGKKAANLVFGNQNSVLVGDFLFARAFQLMTTSESIPVLRILSDASAIITEGEVLQLSIAGNIDSGMDNYMKVIQAKTAALFAAACEVGPEIAQASADHAQALHNYGLHMGIAFQIADDALDYIADEETLGKTVGDDFCEGKLTAPVLIALKDANEDERAFWQNIFSKDEATKDDLTQAIEIMQKHDAMNKALDLARDYSAKAKTNLAQTPEHNLKTILMDIADYVVERDH